MRIAVIGTGYVGLVSGTCLAELGHEVACVDIDAEKVRMIQSGTSPIFEPGLSELLTKHTASGTLHATTDLAEAVLWSEIIIIAVGTPSLPDGSIDLTYVKQTALEIGDALRTDNVYRVVVVKSTSVPGTTDSVVIPILEAHANRSLGTFGVCMNPEFLREGTAVADFLDPDRIVIGASDDRAGHLYAEVYQSISCPLLHTNLRSAEMTKYTANALLPLLVSFSNEIATLCEEIGGVDVKDVMAGVHLDRRFMPKVSERSVKHEGRIEPGMLRFLEAGSGFGGSCFPKDVRALTALAKSYGYEPHLLDGILTKNTEQPLRLLARVEKQLGGFGGKTVAVWGLAFKPETDDVRESIALPVIRALCERGARVIAHDPQAIDQARGALTDLPVVFVKNANDAIFDAHALFVLTAWNVYRIADLSLLEPFMQPSAVVADGRRLFDRAFVESSGLRYIGVGYKEHL